EAFFRAAGKAYRRRPTAFLERYLGRRRQEPQPRRIADRRARREIELDRTRAAGSPGSELHHVLLVHDRELQIGRLTGIHELQLDRTFLVACYLGEQLFDLPDLDRIAGGAGWTRHGEFRVEGKLRQPRIGGIRNGRRGKRRLAVMFDRRDLCRQRVGGADFYVAHRLFRLRALLRQHGQLGALYDAVQLPVSHGDGGRTYL